jgi:hypothetical protein
MLWIAAVIVMSVANNKISNALNLIAALAVNTWTTSTFHAASAKNLRWFSGL